MAAKQSTTTSSPLSSTLQKLKKRLNPKGQEVLDPTPVAPPVGYNRQRPLAEQIRDMVRSERLAQEVQNAGFETFEEADDFDIPDDPIDPNTPYEGDFDVSVSELRRRQAEENARQGSPEATGETLDGPKPKQATKAADTQSAAPQPKPNVPPQEDAN